MPSTDPVAEVEVPVLVIGGSLVGLATSMFLAQHGVEVLSVEKHLGTAIHPRAGYFQLRTIELMRVAGIEDRVRAAALELYDPDGGMNAVESLTGREIANYIPNINGGVADVSPARRLFMPQQVLEPLLLQRAREFGARFQYATELVGYVQDDDGVTATVRSVTDGSEQLIRAKYMVACDGNRSPIRESLGIKMIGHGLMSRSVTIYFRADCSVALRGRNLGVIYVNNPDVRGFFRLEKTGLGGFLVVFTVGDINEPGARFVADIITDEMAVQLVRDAVGDPDLEVNVLDVDKWRAVAEAADTFQRGRIFIAGDAAHTMPPTGGFGGNTGIQDAHNIAWKLAMALEGTAGPALVDTYDQERQPAGVQAIEQAYNRYVSRSDPDLGTEGMHEAIPDMHVEFNRYRSTAVVSDDDYVDDGRPPHRPAPIVRPPGDAGTACRAEWAWQDTVDPRPVCRGLRVDGRAGWRSVGRCREGSRRSARHRREVVHDRRGWSLRRSIRRLRCVVLDGVRHRYLGSIAGATGWLRRVASGGAHRGCRRSADSGTSPGARPVELTATAKPTRRSTL